MLLAVIWWDRHGVEGKISVMKECEDALPLHSVSPRTDSWRMGSRTACRAGLYYRWPWFLEGLPGPCSPASPPQVWPGSAQRSSQTWQMCKTIVWLCPLLVSSGSAVLRRWLCWGSQRRWRLGQRWCSQMKSGSPKACKTQNMYLIMVNYSWCQWLKEETGSHPIS